MLEAGEGDRTLIYSLEGCHTNRCVTPAKKERRAPARTPLKRPWLRTLPRPMASNRGSIHRDSGKGMSARGKIAVTAFLTTPGARDDHLRERPAPDIPLEQGRARESDVGGILGFTCAASRGGRDRTGDLRVMSPASYHCSTPQKESGTGGPCRGHAEC